MQNKTFETLREIIYEKCGISLGENKYSLVQARLAKRMRTLNLSTHEDYLKFLLNDQSGNELVQMIDAISTNVTSFFREEQHFAFLQQEFDRWISEGQKRFRFWSAACSSGEEPYTMAITLLEASKFHPSIDLKILATDISTKILDKSIRGEYSEDKIKGLNKIMLDKYFIKTTSEDTVVYRVKDFVKNLITFKRLNLSKPPFPMKGPFDTIFCRNVMIYFDNIVRKNLLDNCYRILKNGGYIIVGHAESLTGMMMDNMKSMKPAIYRKS